MTPTLRLLQRTEVPPCLLAYMDANTFATPLHGALVAGSLKPSIVAEHKAVDSAHSEIAIAAYLPLLSSSMVAVRNACAKALNKPAYFLDMSMVLDKSTERPKGQWSATFDFWDGKKSSYVTTRSVGVNPTAALRDLFLLSIR